ncbi:MAG: hypothetical protein ACK5LS_05940 [Propioniciclava sp.]
MDAQSAAGADDLERLRRWAGSGAHWQVRALSGTRAEVELLTCDGGEVMEVLVSEELDLLAYVSGPRAGVVTTAESDSEVVVIRSRR